MCGNQTISVDALNNAHIYLGVFSTFNAHSQVFDFSAWAETLGDGTFSVSLLRPNESVPYPVQDLVVSGTTATWTFDATDTEIAGYGKVFLSYRGSDFLDMTVDIPCFIAENSSPSGEVPDPLENWYQDVLDASEAAQQSATNASNSADTASDSADDAEAWAVGTIDGAAVPSGDPRYNNNSKYYATNARNSAQNSSVFASDAEGFAGESQGYATDSEAWAVGTINGTPVSSGDARYNNNSKYYATEAAGSASDASDSADAAAASASAMQTSGAEVGDLIKVKTVDGDGKPTAWEAQKITNEFGDIIDGIEDLPTANAVFWAAVDPFNSAPINLIVDPHAGDLVRIKSVQNGVITGYEAVTPPPMEIGVEYEMPGEFFLGKQVYAQVVSITIPTSSGTNSQTTISVSSVDRMVSCEAWVRRDSDGVTFSLPYADGTNDIMVSATGRGTLANSIFVIVRTISGSTFNGLSGYALLKYTK